MRRTIPLLLLPLTLMLVSCGSPLADPDVGSATPEPGGAERRVAIEGDSVVLRDGGGERVLATLPEEHDGRLEHVALRPGEHPTDTVVALTRTADRYELRYLVVGDDEVSDLYGFPWRLQVDEDLTRYDDVAPLPVWSPEGATLAWLEWGEHGTRLRTVDWMPDDEANNPSEEAAAYQLAEVPTGTQLERWDHAEATTTLVGSDGEAEWRIELRPKAGAVAMEIAGD